MSSGGVTTWLNTNRVTPDQRLACSIGYSLSTALLSGSGHSRNQMRSVNPQYHVKLVTFRSLLWIWSKTIAIYNWYMEKLCKLLTICLNLSLLYRLQFTQHIQRTQVQKVQIISSSSLYFLLSRNLEINCKPCWDVFNRDYHSTVSTRNDMCCCQLTQRPSLLLPEP